MSMLPHRLASYFQPAAAVSRLRCCSRCSCVRSGRAVTALQEAPGAGQDEGPLCQLGVGGGGCPIADMKVPTNVKLPTSDETKCLWGDDYNFGAFSGDPDKVLIHFSKGGACWKGNASTGNSAHMICNPKIDMKPGGDGDSGISNHTDDNPLKDFTMIRVKSCSGNVFIGNSTDPSFNDVTAGARYSRSEQAGSNSTIVYFKGYNQVRAVLDWAKANFPGKLSKFVISGGSAGALGAGMWTSTLLTEMSYVHGYTMYDSYVSLLPAGVPSQIFNYWNGCKLPISSAAQQSACEDADINAFKIETSVIEAMDANIDVKF
ncbi:unnamed protein product [Polarella glacialis]|uniref:Pectin acetylesterase n=1 Tax=Polarella glacialis TaxID=89957 RepID=A0A813G1G1_POLGL|nr:unnamed protein product [Polarella glacialis]